MADERERLFARPDAPHRVHDLLLVAALAAGDGQAGDRDRGRELVEACAECAALAEDLRAIQRTTAVLPPPQRPRDFRLTKADAARLRPTGLRGAFAVVARPRLERAHPIAAGLTMLGLTGLLVSSLSLAAGPSADSAGAAPTTPDAAGDGAVHLQVQTPVPAAGATAPAELSLPAGGQERANAGTPEDTSTNVAVAAPGPDLARLVIAVASAVAVLAGLWLFVLARRARSRHG